MKTRRILEEDLDKILRRAHRSRESLPTGELGFEALMRRIRRLPETRTGGGWWSFETLVWRLAPATGALALGLLAIWMNIDLIADADLFQLFYPTQYLSLLAF